MPDPKPQPTPRRATLGASATELEVLFGPPQETRELPEPSGARHLIFTEGVSAVILPEHGTCLLRLEPPRPGDVTPLGVPCGRPALIAEYGAPDMDDGAVIFWHFPTWHLSAILRSDGDAVSSLSISTEPVTVRRVFRRSAG